MYTEGFDILCSKEGMKGGREAQRCICLLKGYCFSVMLIVILAYSPFKMSMTLCNDMVIQRYCIYTHHAFD